jgi:hypothetical protein
MQNLPNELLNDVVRNAEDKTYDKAPAVLSLLRRPIIHPDNHEHGQEASFHLAFSTRITVS